jgi:hypothetical protein
MFERRLVAMTSRAIHWVLLITAIGFWTIEAAPAWAEGDPAALAAALKDTAATLQAG